MKLYSRTCISLRLNALENVKPIKDNYSDSDYDCDYDIKSDCDCDYGHRLSLTLVRDLDIC